MTDLWPWLTAAGAGALHGLHPAGGWALAAVWGLRRKAHGLLLTIGVVLCLLLALNDAGHSMAPMLWGLCFGAPTGTGLANAGSWVLVASLIAVHVAAWLAVSAVLAAGARRAVSAWRSMPAP
jgi:membrane protein implicated in regulation of membrane protease activity